MVSFIAAGLRHLPEREVENIFNIIFIRTDHKNRHKHIVQKKRLLSVNITPDFKRQLNFKQVGRFG